MIMKCCAGIALFILNTGFGGFIKFHLYYPAAIVLAGGLAPGLIGCVYYHARWMPYLLDTRVNRTAVSHATGPRFNAWQFSGPDGFNPV